MLNPKTNKKKKSKTTPSWKSIPQTFHTGAVSFVARKRQILQFLKFASIGVVLCALLFGVASGVRWLKENPHELLFAGSSKPLKNVFFETDGVLTHDWLDEHLDLPEHVSLMDVDIFDVQASLMDYGQTKQVMVERIFPDALRVMVKEHSPVLRLVIMDAIGKKHVMLVSNEGHVYSGINYQKHVLNGLPFIIDVELKRRGHDFERLKGISKVAELLDTARLHFPQLYSDWKFVSCKRFDGNAEDIAAEIHVHTKSTGVLEFSLHDFEDQLQKLADMLHYSKRRGLARIEGVDLTLTQPVLKLATLQLQRGSLRAHH